MQNKEEEAGKQSSAAASSGFVSAKKPDPLLLCLVFLTSHYGRAKSAESIIAGLPYSSGNMGPELFCAAAQRLDLKAQIIKRNNLNKISNAVLPAVLILKNNQACVLLSRSKNGKKAQIYSPETGASRDISTESLARDYAGYCIYTHPESTFHNPDNVNKDDTRRHWFWGVVAESRGIYMMVLIASAIINLFVLVSPLFIMNVYDRVIPNNAIETGWALGLGALTAFIFDFILRTVRGYMIDLSGRKIDVIAGRRIYDQVLNMRLSERPRSSGVFANMLKDFDCVREFFTSATITALVDLPFALFFIFIIWKLAGTTMVIILLGLIVAVFVIGLVLQFPLKRLVRKATKSSEAKHGLLVESIHGLETIKSIGADGRFRARYGDYIAENAAYGQQSRFVSALGVNIATFLQQSASIIIVLTGMYLVRDAELTMGGLIAAVILGGRAIAPIGQIANLMARYHHASSALKTLEQVMSSQVERPAGKQFLHRPDLKGKVKFDNVGFSYPGVKRQVLEKASFVIQPGEKVGIIGRIGSGKSTIARLILGLYQPNEGSILVDDTDYRQIDPADLRRQCAYISQDVFLFSGSVRDNITASLPHADEREILKASMLSGAHDFISRHPMGYDAPVGENGSGLSGGQRQTIALARAMLLNPALLVCDEPTNAMDVQAENIFMRYVKEQVKDQTFILVTHKNTMLPLVDRLILVDQGKIVMDGERDAVLKALSTGKVNVPASASDTQTSVSRKPVAPPDANK